MFYRTISDVIFYRSSYSEDLIQVAKTIVEELNIIMCSGSKTPTYNLNILKFSIMSKIEEICNSEIYIDFDISDSEFETYKIVAKLLKNICEEIITKIQRDSLYNYYIEDYIEKITMLITEYN